MEIRTEDIHGDLLRLAYVPVRTAHDKLIEKSDTTKGFLNGKNPKLHNIGGIAQSIREYGFQDPAKYDSTVDAIIHGNGRIECLYLMEKDKDAVPRGIATDKDGVWYIPVIFGVDAKSAQAALRYSVDHNNLVVAGGDTNPYDLVRMWNKEGFINLLTNLQESNEMPITFSSDDLRYIMGSDDDDDEESEEPEKDDMKITISVGNPTAWEDIKDGIRQLLRDNKIWKAYIV